MNIGQSELISIVFMIIVTVLGLALCYVQKERKLHPEEMGKPDERKYLKGELVTVLGGILAVMNLSQYSQIGAIIYAVVVTVVYIFIQLRKK